jgi:hypothetical protein
VFAMPIVATGATSTQRARRVSSPRSGRASLASLRFVFLDDFFEGMCLALADARSKVAVSSAVAVHGPGPPLADIACASSPIQRTGPLAQVIDLIFCRRTCNATPPRRCKAPGLPVTSPTLGPDSDWAGASGLDSGSGDSVGKDWDLGLVSGSDWGRVQVRGPGLGDSAEAGAPGLGRPHRHSNGEGQRNGRSWRIKRLRQA